MKPFSIAAAIEAGRVTAQQRIQTAPGKLTIGGRTIGDAHANGVLTVAEVVAKSSNVGTAKIALELSPHTLWDLYTKVGFGQAPRVAVGAAAGRLRPANSWRPIEQATISYGYGVAVSLLQLARAYTVFARDGDVVPLSLVKLDAPPASIPVLRPETAAEMRSMLEMAVGDGGTAPRARIDAYRVAGKTGTARKLRGGRYVNEYVASFAGFAPVSQPRIVVAVMIDEPDGGQIYGGQVAAPVFADVVSRSLRTLQVPPDSAPAMLARGRSAASEAPL
jgi:cell division protein FtsI (penicillin-binding protein 3)